MYIYIYTNLSAAKPLLARRFMAHLFTNGAHVKFESVRKVKTARVSESYYDTPPACSINF